MYKSCELPKTLHVFLTESIKKYFKQKVHVLKKDNLKAY